MTTVGDVVSDLQSIADGAYLDIQPTSDEWVIHNLYHASDVELYWYDGSNEVLIDSDTGAGVWAKYAFHVKNAIYLRVKNVKGDTNPYKIGYDGVITKVVPP